MQVSRVKCGIKFSMFYDFFRLNLFVVDVQKLANIYNLSIKCYHNKLKKSSFDSVFMMGTVNYSHTLMPPVFHDHLMFFFSMMVVVVE